MLLLSLSWLGLALLTCAGCFSSSRCAGCCDLVSLSWSRLALTFLSCSRALLLLCSTQAVSRRACHRAPACLVLAALSASGWLHFPALLARALAVVALAMVAQAMVVRWPSWLSLHSRWAVLSSLVLRSSCSRSIRSSTSLALASLSLFLLWLALPTATCHRAPGRFLLPGRLHALDRLCAGWSCLGCRCSRWPCRISLNVSGLVVLRLLCL